MTPSDFPKPRSGTALPAEPRPTLPWDVRIPKSLVIPHPKPGDTRETRGASRVQIDDDGGMWLDEDDGTVPLLVIRMTERVHLVDDSARDLAASAVALPAEPRPETPLGREPQARFNMMRFVSRVRRACNMDSMASVREAVRQLNEDNAKLSPLDEPRLIRSDAAAVSDPEAT